MTQINFKFQISNKNQKLNLSIGNWKLEIRNSYVGVTLLELLIYMGLLTIFLTVLTSIFTSTIDVQLSSQGISSVQQDGRFALARIMYDLHKADSITAPASLGSTSNTLTFLVDSTTYTYSTSSGNLILSDGTYTSQINGHNTSISNFSVTRLGNNTPTAQHTMRVSFTVTSKTRENNGFESKDFSTVVGLR